MSKLNKIFSVNTKKIMIPALSVVFAVIIVIAAAVGTLCGVMGWGGVFNRAATISDSQMVTVTMESFLYEKNGEKIQEKCEDILSDHNVLYVEHGEGDGGEQQIVFVFDDKEDLTASYAKLKDSMTALTATGGEYEGWSILVMKNTVEVESYVSEYYVLRGCIAGAVIAVLACIYAILRYGWRHGIVAGVCVLLGMLVTTAIIMATRILITPAVAIAIAAAALITALAVILNLGKLRANEKDENVSMQSEELVISSLAIKEQLFVYAALALSMLLLGILGGTAIAWFCVSVGVAIIVSAVIGLFYAPACMIPAQKGTEIARAKKPARKEKKAKASKVKEVTAEEIVAEAEDED
ncbi:MAG: hypothetical protein IKA20_05875 [Clostridia bacterium]|nr:hypothetical protein [Clostridia bacterium]